MNADALAPLRIAIVETCDAPPDIAANLTTGLLSLARAAEAGARLVQFPELFVTGYYLDQAMVARAAAADEALARLHTAAAELSVEVVVGAPQFDGRRLLNTVAVLRPGREPERYVKTHLYPPEIDWFTPGPSLWTGEVAGWPCGIIVCYELGFPEIARSLALAGARLLLAPSAWGMGRAHIWDVATVARALENSCYLAAADQAGGNGTLTFRGASRVVDPLGSVIAGEGPPHLEVRGPGGVHRVWLADLDSGAPDRARAGEDGWHRYFTDRRPELYRRLCEGSPESSA